MPKGIVSDIGEKLGMPDERITAVESLRSIDSFDRQFADVIVDDLVAAYREEGGTYTQLQLLKQIERLAENHPRIASRAVYPIATKVNAILADYDGNEPSENREVAIGTEILYNVLKGTDPADVTVDLEYRDIRSFVERGNARQRGLCYRLLGRAATGESVRILLRDYSHEVESVREERKAGLVDAGKLVMSSIGGDGPLCRYDATIAFTELYAADRINPPHGQVNVVEENLFDLVNTDCADNRDETVDAVERLARRDPDAAERLVSEAFRCLESSSSDRLVAWTVLRGCASGASRIVLNRAEALARELRESRGTELVSALEVVRTASNRVTSVPATVAETVLHTVESSKESVAMSAIQTVAEMGFYPAPRPLVELEEKGNPTLARAASEARKRLESGGQVPEFVSSLRSGSAGVGLFAGDSGQVKLKYRSESGLWVDLNIGALRKGIIEAAVQRVDRDESAPIVYPYYEPREVIVLALALILDSPKAERWVGLYSPGSQTQWGQKGEIREELRKYGLADQEGAVVSATPVPTIIPESYVWNGEVRDNSEGDGPGRLVLTKKLPELHTVEELDVVLLNRTARNPFELDEAVEELEGHHSEVNFADAYSYYTRHESEGRPRYGPPSGFQTTQTIPGVDLLDPIFETREAGENSIDSEIRALTEERQIQIEHVETDVLSDLFQQLFEESAGLWNVDDDGAGGLIFSNQMFFERLPVPADDYEEWVRARYNDGDIYVPPLIRERIADIERRAGSIENLETVRPLNTAKNLLERVNQCLRDENPLFEALKEHISEARKSGTKIAIFRESPKHAQLLRDTLIDRGVVSSETLEAGDVNVVSPNDARNVSHYDELLVFGALHPENAGFYVHPRVEETVVLTYDPSWADMIERHAAEFVDSINECVGGSDYEPYTTPTLVGDLEPEQDKSEAEKTVAGGNDSVERPVDPRPTESKAEFLANAMKSYSATEYGEDTSRYERSLRRYVVKTANGEELEFTNHESVLRQRTVGSQVEFHWASPEALSEGDTFATLPDGLEAELWHEHIREVYEGRESLTDAIEGLRIWYDSLSRIWERSRTELADSGVVPSRRLHSTIYEWIDEENDDFDRVQMTVRQWFESIREADSPIDLVRDSSLIIGPRSASDIEAVGRAFGYEALVEDAEMIEGTMRALRRMNQREGHRFNDSIQAEMNSSEPTRVSENATYHEVADISEVTDESEGGTDVRRIDGSLDELAFERLGDIVELAPTKNDELADRWGLDSGSEVHKYLTSTLNEYYERNEDKLIVPTERGKNEYEQGLER